MTTCPDFPECQTCPAACEDDVCLPDERASYLVEMVNVVPNVETIGDGSPEHPWNTEALIAWAKRCRELQGRVRAWARSA